MTVPFLVIVEGPVYALSEVPVGTPALTGDVGAVAVEGGWFVVAEVVGVTGWVVVGVLVGVLVVEVEEDAEVVAGWVPPVTVVVLVVEAEPGPDWRAVALAVCGFTVLVEGVLVTLVDGATAAPVALDRELYQRLRDCFHHEPESAVLVSEVARHSVLEPLRSASAWEAVMPTRSKTEAADAPASRARVERTFRTVPRRAASASRRSRRLG